MKEVLCTVMNQNIRVQQAKINTTPFHVNTAAFLAVVLKNGEEWVVDIVCKKYGWNDSAMSRA